MIGDVARTLPPKAAEHTRYPGRQAKSVITAGTTNQLKGKV